MGEVKESVVERHPELRIVGQEIIDCLDLPPFFYLSAASRFMPVGVISTGEKYLIPQVDPAEVVRAIIETDGLADVRPKGEILRLDSPIKMPITALSHKIGCCLKSDTDVQERFVWSLKLLSKRMPGITSQKGAVKLMEELKRALHEDVDFYVFFTFPETPIWLDKSQPREVDSASARF